MDVNADIRRWNAAVQARFTTPRPGGPPTPEAILHELRRHNMSLIQTLEQARGEWWDLATQTNDLLATVDHQASTNVNLAKNSRETNIHLTQRLVEVTEELEDVRNENERLKQALKECSDPDDNASEVTVELWTGLQEGIEHEFALGNRLAEEVRLGGREWRVRTVLERLLEKCMAGINKRTLERVLVAFSPRRGRKIRLELEEVARKREEAAK